jgi:lipoyl-dependent peroxiredoxin
MALALRLGEHKTVPERLIIAATVTLDDVGGVPTIVSSQLRVSARVPGLDAAGFEAVVGEASELCPVSRLFAGAKITVEAVLEPGS